MVATRHDVMLYGGGGFDIMWHENIASLLELDVSFGDIADTAMSLFSLQRSVSQYSNPHAFSEKSASGICANDDFAAANMSLQP